MLTNSANLINTILFLVSEFATHLYKISINVFVVFFYSPLLVLLPFPLLTQ